MDSKRWQLSVGSLNDSVKHVGGFSDSTVGTVRASVRQALSRREREVLSLIVLGKTDRQIADELFISRITVSNHVVHILDKLDVPNRTAAAMVAMSGILRHGHGGLEL
jgi:DNA-binding NarL/FixJ family response regulator